MIHLPETLIEVPASIIPLFGRTQYRRGAVVFTLKQTFLSVGLESLRFVVITSENGPVKIKKIKWTKVTYGPLGRYIMVKAAYNVQKLYKVL